MSVTDQPGSRRQRPRERLIEAILLATARHGFGATTVEEILAEANVTRRVFEAVFPEGRAECLMAAYEQSIDQAFEIVKTACERSGGVGVPAVEAGLSALLDSMVECPTKTRVCVIEIASLGAYAREARNRTIERFAALLRVVTGGRPRSRTQTEAIVAGWYYVLHATVLEGRTEELGKLLPDMVYMITIRQREESESRSSDK